MNEEELESINEDPEYWRVFIRSWLEDNLPADLKRNRHLNTEENFNKRKAWEFQLYEAGLAAIHWPVEYGGQGLGAEHRMIFQEEYERAGAPPRLNIQGLMLAGPTLIKYGTESQKARWIEPILKCEEIWCQGFSEPDAGSDLAALHTSANLEGSEWVVNGQKIWTSGATHSDWMFALVRTEKDAGKHSGITALFIDMNSKGLEVRPIRQINNRTTFSEVFFNDVRVPVENTMGARGNGWKVATDALTLERGIGRRSHEKYLPLLEELKKLISQLKLPEKETFIEEFGRLILKVHQYKNHVGRTIAESEDGQFGPEVSLNKFFWSEMEFEIFELGMKLYAFSDTGKGSVISDTDYIDWEGDYWYSRATRIFAGSNQIQRNIIAERVLGLPKEKK